MKPKKKNKRMKRFQNNIKTSTDAVGRGGEDEFIELFLITDPFSSFFQGLIGPQGPIGPPGEKVSKTETEAVGHPPLCSAASIKYQSRPHK